MTYHESGGFLRDDPPVGASVGALVVVGGTGGGGGSSPTGAITDGMATPASTELDASFGLIWDQSLNTGAGGWVKAPGTVANGQLVDVSRVAGTVNVAGPLTDTQLRASAVPVSMATQTPDVTDRAARLLGHVTVDNASLAVTGPLTDTQLRASAVPVSGSGVFHVDDNAGSLTVDAPVGTPVATRISDGAAFIDPRQMVDGTTPTQKAAVSAAGRLSVDASGVAVPVTDNAGSLTVDAPVGTPVFARLSDGAAALVGQKAMANSLPVAVASDQSALPVTGPTLTKATQGANGFSVQDLKDSGRVAITITAYQLAGIITTEALFAASLVRAADGVAAAAAAQHTVTAGKRFRIQSIAVTVKNTAAAAGTSKLALRYRPAGGTVAITDSIVAILDIGSNNATAANYIGPYLMEIPDGFEMIAGATYGFTNLSSAVTMLHTITLVGFEY